MDFVGPRPDAPCPCGSEKLGVSCHAYPDGSWRAESPTLFDRRKPRTQFAHPSCYASALNDCSRKLSREHYLSADVLTAMGEIHTIEGAAWAKGRAVNLPTGALTAKVLCDRHNEALSPLDAEAGRIFRTLRGFQDALGDPLRRDIEEFGLANGAIFERWLLKTWWGLATSGVVGSEGKPLTGLRRDVDERLLLRALFYGEAWPQDHGMYLVVVPDVPFKADALVAIQALSRSNEQRLWAGVIAFGVIAFHLLLGAPEDQSELRYRPGGIIMRAEGATHAKIMALGWPRAGHQPASLTRIADRS